MADLETEMRQAHRLIFGDKPRRYDEPQALAVRDLITKTNADRFNLKYDESLKELRALGAGAAPQLLEYFYLPGNHGNGYTSLPLYRVLLEWKTAAAFDVWLARSYEGGIYLPWFLASLDGVRARPHLEQLFESLPEERNRNLGAALGLAKLGEKRVVPRLFQSLGNYDSAWENLAIDALKPLTGQNFALRHEWVKWWKEEGSHQEW